jgi:hypothetical protein
MVHVLDRRAAAELVHRLPLRTAPDGTCAGAASGLDFAEFSPRRARGWDVRRWNGFGILRDIRDLHTLSSYIRRSHTDPAAAAELQLRVEVLRTEPESPVLWHAA